MKTHGGFSKAWHLALRSGSVGLLIGLIFTGCSSAREFQRFARTDETGLYILRPNSPILAIYSFDVDIYRYPGHFSEGGETLAKSASLHTGEYIYLKLTPGFYLIHLKEQEGHKHILHIRNGQTSIRSVEIFNRGLFSRADIRIVELDREQAAGFLITEAGRMYAHPQSEDQ
ncbi:MAG: hypothetical protein CVV45_14840 [Spirochaetae bacterium HGW-Spirochaetae-10]|nr:MAG: hypothetical protein CVV45_14840 [Spirochaetae bacterium HGW-Spirochaetae-10]